MNILKQIKAVLLDKDRSELSSSQQNNFVKSSQKPPKLLLQQKRPSVLLTKELPISIPKDLSCEEEEQIIRKLDKAKDCTEYYWIEAQWVKDWAGYIHGDKAPGKLKTSKLRDPNGAVRKDLKIGTDYRALNKQQWLFLSHKYGAESPIISASPIYLEPNSEEIEPEDSLTPRFDATNLKLPSSLRSEHFRSNSCIEGNPKNSFFEAELLEANPLFSIRKDSFEIPSVEGDINTPLTEAEEIEIKSNIESATRSTANTMNESELSFLCSGPFKVKSGRVGLENPGLFCYMNAGLQLLFTIPEVKESLLQQNIDFQEKNLLKIMSELAKQIFIGKSKKIRPESFWDYISTYYPLSRQHDLPEFLRFIINKLEQELPVITQIFNGNTCSKITCNNCFQVSKKYERFVDLQLELSSSVEKSFLLFTKEERLTANYDCDVCNEKSEVSKQFKISKAPSYLLIQVKRFRQMPYPHKVSTSCRYKKRMSLENFAVEKSEYELLGVAVHNGSIDNGHYLSYCKRGHSWYLFDDAKCTKVSLKEVLNLNAYVLLYQKVDTN